MEFSHRCAAVDKFQLTQRRAVPLRQTKGQIDKQFR